MSWLWFPSFLFFALVVLSFKKIRRNKGLIDFIYHWGFPLGSFVWEDLLVFSLYGLVGSLITLSTGQIRIGLLFLIVFWVVRSAGETLYYFLQQFIEPKHFPHDIDAHFKLLRWVFGPINKQQCFILLQVFFQILMMFSLISFIFLMLFWSQLP